MTIGEFAEYIRLNLSYFAGGDGVKTFSPHPFTGENEVGLWNSANAVGAVILIKIPGIDPNIPLSDDGSVIVSEHAFSHESAGWTFSTIHDPFVTDHPVSGTRTFSVYETQDGYMFSTQGADRLTNYLGQFTSVAANGLPFNKADELWTGMQRKVAEFINSHQSSAQILQPVTNRPNWPEVKKALDENRSLSTVPCD